VVGLVGDELPAGGLPDHGQPGERGQARQHPPAHCLRPDRPLDRGGVDIQVVGAERVQRADLVTERGLVGGAVPEPHVVDLQHHPTVVHRRRVRLRREQVVTGPDPVLELVFGHHQAHHPDAAPRDRRPADV